MNEVVSWINELIMSWTNILRCIMNWWIKLCYEDHYFLWWV